MAALLLLALAAVGIGVGFLSGLVGIGGGVLIVPFLYFFYGHPDWAGVSLAAPLVAPVSAATSLFVIMPTALVGTVTFGRAGLVEWRAAAPMGVAAAVAAMGGARIALLLPPNAVRLAFGVFLVFTGAQLLANRSSGATLPQRLGPGATLPAGAAVGLLSALLGVGGGVVAIPLLIHLIRLDVRRVAATSLAVVMLAATAGALTYGWTGADAVGLPAGSIGYVHVTAGLPILVGSVVAVRWGTRLNRRIGTSVLRRAFALLFIALGLRYVGLAAVALW
jgi:hypothetical protein